jgi:hypothetical protein
LPGLLFEPEDVGYIFLRNISWLSAYYTGLYPERWSLHYHRYENLKSDLNLLLSELWLTEWLNYIPVRKLQNIATCRPISRQRPKYPHAKIEKVLEEMLSVCPAPCPALGNGPINKHFTRRVFSLRSDPSLYN